MSDMPTMMLRLAHAEVVAKIAERDKQYAYTAPELIPRGVAYEYTRMMAHKEWLETKLAFAVETA